MDKITIILTLILYITNAHYLDITIDYTELWI